MDSIDQYSKLTNGITPSAREVMVYNIDTRPKNNRSAVRINDYKYTRGHPGHSKAKSATPAPPDMLLNGTATSVDGFEPDEALFNVREDPGETKNLIDLAEDDINLRCYLKKLREVLDAETPKVIPFPDEVPENPMGRSKHYSGANSPGWCCLDEQNLN
ncbi:uncharacterized protein LOC143284305 [Babylonia areolata]|uniref:uncharacterized protein LOC143284305 n=1 Tax=Babylonia areolata TaxID=304850 RepID=UPI003FD63D90